MANNMFQTLQSGFIYQLFNNKPFETPTGIYVGLTYLPPTNQSYSEVLNAGNNYARQPVGTSNGTGVQDWDFWWPFSGMVFNNNQVSFAVANAYWGWVSGVCLFDSAVYSGGNCLFYAPLSPAKEIGQNDQMFIPVSGLSVRLS